MSLTRLERDLVHCRLQVLTPSLPYLLIAPARDHDHVLLRDRKVQAQFPKLGIETEAIHGLGTGLVAVLALQIWRALDMRDAPTADVLTADLAAAALYEPTRKRIGTDPEARSGSILEGVEMNMMLLGVR